MTVIVVYPEGTVIEYGLESYTELDVEELEGTVATLRWKRTTPGRLPAPGVERTTIAPGERTTASCASCSSSHR